MLKNYVCPDCGIVVCDGSTSCIRCGCTMEQIKSGRKTKVKLPYTQWAGHNDVKNAPKDKYGNPNGTDYDLLRDGSMKGYKVLIINLCPSWDTCGQRSNYDNPIKALNGKGFEVEYTDKFPDNFERAVQNVCQLWLISGNSMTITPAQVDKVINYYNQGHGLYLWADNAPFFADVNPVLAKIAGSEMSGDYTGDQILGVQKNSSDCGIMPGHLISTGINNFYEGVTISNVKMTQYLHPLIYSSDRKVVTAYADAGGKRLLIDGGFTRLCVKWDSAGTDRYVVNAAGWLGNFEKFGWNIPR